MECNVLVTLRREATAIFKELTLRQRRAREHAVEKAGRASGSGFLRRGDYEAYLQRRLAKSTARIEAHIATHVCQS